MKCYVCGKPGPQTNLKKEEIQEQILSTMFYYFLNWKEESFWLTRMHIGSKVLDRLWVRFTNAKFAKRIQLIFLRTLTKKSLATTGSRFWHQSHWRMTSLSWNLVTTKVHLIKTLNSIFFNPKSGLSLLNNVETWKCKSLALCRILTCLKNDKED